MRKKCFGATTAYSPHRQRGSEWVELAIIIFSVVTAASCKGLPMVSYDLLSLLFPKG